MSARTIGVVGGGDFGQGLAEAAVRNGHAVRLWSRRSREHAGITVGQDPYLLKECGLIFVAVPSHAVAQVTAQFSNVFDGRHLLVHVSRGVVDDALTTVTRVIRAQTAARRVGALAGPLVAEAIATDTPGAGVVGTRFPEVARAVREAIGSSTLRIYENRDVVGVELATAYVGMLALATGFLFEKSVGPELLGLFATRGLSEAESILDLFGADAKTLSGLAGAGDLFAVLAGDERPEVRLGACDGARPVFRGRG